MKQSRLSILKVVALSLALCGFLPFAHGQSSSSLPDYVIEEYGEAPEVPTGPLSHALQISAALAFIDGTKLTRWGDNQKQALTDIGKSDDPRLAWVISDMLRFTTSRRRHKALSQAASDLLGKTFKGRSSWHSVTSHLLAWDIPAPPDYLDYKRTIFTSNFPGWDKLFVEGSIDWRLVSWGGVLIDNRAYNETDTVCNCIAAALKMPDG